MAYISFLCRHVFHNDLENLTFRELENKKYDAKYVVATQFSQRKQKWPHSSQTKDGEEKINNYYNVVETVDSQKNTN